MSTFEDRLWSQLVREHGDQMQLSTIAIKRHRRRPALVAGTALASVALATAAVLALTAGTGAPPAYAVTTNPDGTVTVTLNDISAITGLNAELARDGLNAQAVPLNADCPIRAPLVTMPAGTDPSTYTITLVPRDIPAGYRAVVAAGTTPSGQVVLLMGAIKPPVPECFNSTARPLQPIDRAHVSPGVKAAIARARHALAAAKR